MTRRGAAGAAKIRDHPFMQLQIKMKDALENEDVLEANRIAAALRELIRSTEEDQNAGP